MSADCITQTLVGSAGVEPTSKRGDRVQGYSLLPLPLGQLPKLVGCQRSKNVAESKRLERLCPLGNTCLANRAGGLLPMLSEETYQ